MGPDEGYFGERVAVRYDEHSGAISDPAVIGPAFSGRHYVIEGERMQPSPIEMRYAWPSELDLMARLAGCGWSTGRKGGAASHAIGLSEPWRAKISAGTFPS